jgi:protein-tyrosine phosphatase
VLKWFKKKSVIDRLNLRADFHSHLLPGLDDGVKSIEESIEIIRRLHQLGYQKLITTPHIISDAYRNSSETILPALADLQKELLKQKIPVALEAAAEYYVDEVLMQQLTDDNPLLTFGDRYLLIETNFLNEPMLLKEFIFLAITKGYKPVLAHPERYVYLFKEFQKLEDLLARGVLFQINITSLAGHYSKPAQQMAQLLIDRGWIHGLGSDCHHMIHVQLIEGLRENKYLQKALTLPLLNNII